MLDIYFKRPVLWDYLIANLACCLFYGLYRTDIISLVAKERSISMTTDIANVGLTSAGFILTLLTVLITFKSASKITKENYTEEDPLFDLFFTSDLYFQTIGILKNCIKSLIFISIMGFGLKTLLSSTLTQYTFFFNIIGLCIIGLTLWRCLLVLTKVLKMQK
jgi:hypothetical protein